MDISICGKCHRVIESWDGQKTQYIIDTKRYSKKYEEMREHKEICRMGLVSYYPSGYRRRFFPNNYLGSSKEPLLKNFP